MSDILIKNMKMPKSCDECFVYKSICPATAKRNKALGDDVVPKNHRHSDCPLIEVLPHGDLIDRDKASKRFAELSENIKAKLGFECSASYTLASLFLQNKGEFPTIIEETVLPYSEVITVEDP